MTVTKIESLIPLAALLMIAMAEDTVTTSEVIDTVNDYFTAAEAEASELAGGVRVVVPEEEVGRMFGLLRREGLEYESKRDPSSDNVVYNIKAEERKGLGELFQ